MWERKLQQVEPLADIDRLPSYGAVFFFKNMGAFRGIFSLLTLGGVISSLLRFATVYLLGRIISDASALTLHQVFTFYLPAWLGAMVCAELLDFFTRKYSEALPAVYGEHLTLRFYLTFLRLPSHRLSNFSKERLMALVGKYVANVSAFLNDWEWRLIMYSTRGVIVLVILAQQSWLVLAANLAYMGLFLWLALRISARFSAIAERYSAQTLESQTVISSLTLNLNTVRRLGIREFYKRVYEQLLGRNWARLEEVRDFHAKRWLLQLNLFNFLYIGTLVFAVWQIKQGLLPLGYLVLLKWAFDELWSILVYIIEYYVSLVQQKQDAVVIRRELAAIVGGGANGHGPLFDRPWQRLELGQAVADLSSADRPERRIRIHVPALEIRHADKIGVLGPSGAGKTTVLNMLLNLVPFSGRYAIDGCNVREMEMSAGQFAIVTNHDPLFKLSLRENIMLGRSVQPETLDRILRGTRVLDFAPNLEARVGDADFHLSAGQEQRIRLARGLLQESRCYLLDEPFNGIDGPTKRAIIAFLKEYLRDCTVVLVTHNRDELELVDRVYALEQGVLRAECVSAG